MRDIPPALNPPGVIHMTQANSNRAEMDMRLPFVPSKNPFDIHVYFNTDQAERAAAVKARLAKRFGWLEEGRWNDTASRLSPHPLPMFEMFGGEAKSVVKVISIHHP